MSKSSSVVVRGVVAAAVVSLSLATSAAAHGLAGGYDPSRPTLEYVWLGYWHMLAGWDHLLFIAGVVLLAGNVRDATKLVFALCRWTQSDADRGHSERLGPRRHPG